ncbi:cytochrome-c peroxidase [Roseobacter sp. YSTF-M11]|uniref:Cytochrome-c peroxidase n=1 Tax=Roseobacter insulae TaxID=2859783 RepID=A0A9X1FWP9_9RHOB|nr:cytochrome c peroxidase [Roseobacter insulae]MBW4709053.1 cytochrome-c peroxidase [Roseobacter insulae]
MLSNYLKPRWPICITGLTGVLFILLLGSVSSQSQLGGYRENRLPKPLEDADYLYDGAPPKALYELGRLLFFDPVLSGNRNISCGTCHDPGLGTGDALALGIGEGGHGVGTQRVTRDPVPGRIPRNAQSLWNVGARQYRSMFHDGRLEVDASGLETSGFTNPAGSDLPPGLPSTLAAQALFPVTSGLEMAGQRHENPVADAVADDNRPLAWARLAARLAAIPEYVDLFRLAFDDVAAADDITFTHAAKALAAFQTQAFRSDQSPFDRFLRTGDASMLSRDAQQGLKLFFGKANCVSCHSGPLLTDHRFHAIGMPQTGPGKGHGADFTYWRETGLPGRLEDEGRYRVTFDQADLFAFRTPSLRNVEITGPWGHSGAFKTLEGVVRHHLDPESSLDAFDSDRISLPRLDQVIRPAGRGSVTHFVPLTAAQIRAFEKKDRWVQKSDGLRGRIRSRNTLASISLSREDIAHIVAFLGSLTDPSALDRSDLLPAGVPSGLAPQPAPSGR